MAERPTEQREKWTYVVALPDGSVGVDAYAQIPLIGATQATSEAGAVSQYVMRHVSQRDGRFILSGIKEGFGPLERFATIVPELGHEPGDKPLTQREQERYRADVFANELAVKAGRKGPEQRDFDRAEYLLRKAGIPFG